MFDRKAYNNEAHKEEKEIHRLRKEYNLTLEDKRNIWKKQNGKCLICKKRLTESRDCHVDHCHVTGKIRGLLCRRCNLILGYANDDPVILQSATDYMEEHTC